MKASAVSAIGVGFFPGEEPGDASLSIDHRLDFAAVVGRRDIEFQVLQTRALLYHADEARIDFARMPEQRAEFGDRVAQGRALLGHQFFVMVPGNLIADSDARHRCHERDQRQHDDRPRRTQSLPGPRTGDRSRTGDPVRPQFPAPRAQTLRVYLELTQHTELPRRRPRYPDNRLNGADLMAGQQTR